MSKSTGNSAQPMWGPFEFKGTLSLGSDSVDTTFQAAMDYTGHLSLDFVDMPINNQTKFILLNWSANDRIVHFSLTAQNDLRTLRTDKLYITSLTSGESLRFSAQCTESKIRVALSKPRTKHAMRYWLRGFRAYRGLKQETSLGTLYIGGPHNVEDFTAMTGQLALESNGVSFLGEEHATAVRDLLEHVVFVMSFASGSFLRVPLKELQTETYLETETCNVSEGEKPYLPPISHLNLEPIFKAAVASHGKLDDFKSLRMAIEWILTPATYNEIALLSRMTALERLIGKNLGKPASCLAPEQRAEFRKVAAGWLAATDLPQDQRDEILGRLGSAGMPTLESRIHTLLQKWNVPLNDLPEKAIKDLIGARNKVVHRGTYYSDDTGDDDKLWTHVTVAHEVLTRVILTALQYEGPYMSYVGGWHQRRFPSCIAHS